MLDINEFKENLVEFECARIRDTSTVWINAATADDLSGIVGGAAPERDFAQYFSYIARDNTCFGEAALDRNDRRTYLAERYGGRGVGTNGGGGRVGNYGKFQVKGVGPNLLASTTSTWHSYGSLNLVDAATEAIYSTVLGRILPLGCAKVYGVIHTSDSGALQIRRWGEKDASTAPMSGALLVRECTLRPAHFMHAELFAEPQSPKLMRESARIRAVHRQLKSRFENNNNFVQFIGKFVLSAARQFAFARAARIAHGGVTVSNICLDGRWIDLTEARFLTGGKNYTNQGTFYDEPQVISEVVTQLTYIFGKSNVSLFNVEPILRYCQKTFDNCFAYYALSILGLPLEGLEAIADSEDGKTFVKAYSTVVMRGKRPVVGIPAQFDPDDPVVAFMRLAYLGLCGDDSCTAALSALMRSQPADAQAVTSAFRNVLHSALMRSHPEADASVLRSGAIACAIKALRWAYLSAYFYRGRLVPRLYELVGDNDVGGVGAYIQACVEQSAWIFDGATGGQVVILETGTLTIAFDCDRNQYVVTGGGTRSFRHYADCLAFVTDEHPGVRVSGDFDPGFYLQGLADVLAKLEHGQFTWP